MRSVIDILDLTTEEIDSLIATAKDIIANPENYADKCKGKKLATLFFEPSTRTRLTFAVSAMLSPLDADDVDADEKPITLPPSSSIAASKLRRVLVEGSKKSVASFLPLHLSA